MNDYMQVRFDVEPCSEMATDVLAAVLAEIGYESFVPDGGCNGKDKYGSSSCLWL